MILKKIKVCGYVSTINVISGPSSMSFYVCATEMDNFFLTTILHILLQHIAKHFCYWNHFCVTIFQKA